MLSGVSEQNFPKPVIVGGPSSHVWYHIALYIAGAELARVQCVHLLLRFFGNSLLETKQREVLH